MNAHDFASWLRSLGCRSPLREILVALARERGAVDAERVVDEALAELAREDLAHPDEAGDHRWRIGPWGLDWHAPSYDVQLQPLEPGDLARVLARYPKRTQPRSADEQHVEDRRSWLSTTLRYRFTGLLSIDADSLASAWPCRCEACSADVVLAEATRAVESSLPMLEQSASDEAELVACVLRDRKGT